MLLIEACEIGVDLCFGARHQNVELQAPSTRRVLQVSHKRLRRKIRVHKEGDRLRVGYKFGQSSRLA